MPTLVPTPGGDGIVDVIEAKIGRHIEARGRGRLRKINLTHFRHFRDGIFAIGIHKKGG